MLMTVFWHDKQTKHLLDYVSEYEKGNGLQTKLWQQTVMLQLQLQMDCWRKKWIL